MGIFNMTTKSKIALISSSFPPFSEGGVSTSNYHLYLALKSSNYPIKVFTYNDSEEDSTQQDVSRHGTLKIYKKVIDLMFVVLFKLIDPGKEAFYISYIFQTFPGVIATFLSVLRYWPDITIIPDQDLPGLLLSFLPGKKVWVAHNIPARFQKYGFLPPHSNIEISVMTSVEKWLLSKMDAIIAPSNYIKSVCEEVYMPTIPIYVIQNIVCENQFEKNDKNKGSSDFGYPRKQPIIYLPTPSQPIKGTQFSHEIIRRIAASYKKPIAFYIPGYINKQTLDLYRYLPKNAYLYTPGQLTYLEHIRRVRASSFMIAPFIDESFSMTIREANILGIPAVAFDAGGNRDIIKNGKNGYLIKLLDIEDMIDKSKELLNSRNLKKLKQQTRDFSTKQLSVLSLLNKYEKLFSEI